MWSLSVHSIDKFCCIMISKCCCHILILFLCQVKSEFTIGKVPPASFDLTELNGFYTKQEAVDACEESKICAGFTYRGLLNVTHFPDKKYEVYFFRYIHHIGADVEFSNWVTYEASKMFAEYDGIFEGRTVPLSDKERNSTSLDMCYEDNCAAVTAYTHSGELREKYLTIDISMDAFVPDPNIKTFLNLNVNEDVVKDNTQDIDLCCPPHDRDFDVKSFMTSVNDTLPRISCDIPVKEFVEKYILPREPVMLTGCIDNWVATKTWTMKNMLQRYNNDITWKTDVSLEDDSPIDETTIDPAIEPEYEDMDMKIRVARSYEHLNLHGNAIMDLMEKNATVRIFERVGVPPRREKVVINITNSHKPDLFQEWGWPRAIPEDLYKPTFGGSDYQWIIMSQGTTGTHIHHDPSITDAWNALLSGHKYWVALPKDVYAGSYECDMRCSKKFDMLYAVSWYTHVLPQLREERWYGKGVIETIQHPGEIIFIPHGQGHAVLNLDENVSITENFLSVGAVDELTQFFAYDWNPLSYDSEGASKRVWVNLMNRDLKDSKIKKFAREMLKQVRSVENRKFEVPMNPDFFT